MYILNEEVVCFTQDFARQDFHHDIIMILKLSVVDKFPRISLLRLKAKLKFPSVFLVQGRYRAPNLLPPVLPSQTIEIRCVCCVHSFYTRVRRRVHHSLLYTKYYMNIPFHPSSAPVLAPSSVVRLLLGAFFGPPGGPFSPLRRVVSSRGVRWGVVVVAAVFGPLIF